MEHPKLSPEQAQFSARIKAERFGLDKIGRTGRDKEVRAWLKDIRRGEADSDHFGYIYKITNTETGQAYIGQTRRSLSNRLRDHFEDGFRAATDSTSYDTAYPLHKAIADAGLENTGKFQVVVLETGFAHGKAREWLNEREQHHITAEKTHVREGGYNQNGGGAGSRDVSEAVAVKRDANMSASRHGEQSPLLRPIAMKLLRQGYPTADVADAFGYSEAYTKRLAKQAATLTPEQAKLNQGERLATAFARELRDLKTTVIGQDLTGKNRQGARLPGHYTVNIEDAIKLGILHDAKPGTTPSKGKSPAR